MPIRYMLAGLQAEARHQPSGRAAQLLALGKIDGKVLWVEEADYREIDQKFPPPNFFYPLRHPTQFTLLQIKSCAHQLPAGYVDFVVTCGRMQNDLIVLDEAAVERIGERFPPAQARVVPQVPTVTELAANFSSAMARWAQAGFQVVERVEYERRLAVCTACHYWQPDALLGTGRCKRCGCSGVKLWLGTSRCPDKPPRW